MEANLTNPKADDKLLRNAQRLVSGCDRCGACLTVCPLFGARDVEASSARGKNAITRALAEGGVAPSAEALGAVNFCLLCRACVENCPSKVKTDEAMIDVRQHLIRVTGGINAKYRLAGGFLKSPLLVKLAAGALALFRKLGLGGLFPYGMVPEAYTRAHFLAAFSGPAALGGPAPQSRVDATKAARVAYFQGCGMRMMFPEAAAETVSILASTAQVVERNNVCCGLPHLAHGLRGQFLDLARKNIGLYEDADLIVSDCASCGGTLKHIAAWFESDPVWRERAAAFSGKVMDLAEYLAKVGYVPRRKVDASFTYHDPCHLARGQGIRREPRDLLRLTGRFVEMEEAETCCGGAGSFHVDYPDVAAKILAKKQANIEKTGAEVVVTGCPGCLIQMSKAARASGGKFKAMHLSQVI
jgi:glycolate oxidase iron-sulfur subunit